ncbi:MAG: hypothetical protein WC758_03390 [Candidatus Woesearchaeota archaeon]|jgi:hypothetical protein
MIDQILQLNDRYGPEHNYQSLTEMQKDLLLNSSIMNNTDGCGEKTVKVININEESEETLLDLLDVHSYVFYKNGPGSRGNYANHRIPFFKRALGITEEPIKLDGPQIYLFQLPNNSKVRVQYDSIKD